MTAVDVAAPNDVEEWFVNRNMISSPGNDGFSLGKLIDVDDDGGLMENCLPQYSLVHYPSCAALATEEQPKRRITFSYNKIGWLPKNKVSISLGSLSQPGL